MAGRDRELLIPVASEALGLNGCSDVAGPTPVSPAIVAPPYHAMTLEVASSSSSLSQLLDSFMGIGSLGDDLACSFSISQN